MIRGLGRLTFVLLTLACAAEQRPADSKSSALALTRELAFGTSDGPAQLAKPLLVLIARDGATLIADGGRILAFDSVGMLIRTIGREGEGPGEFRDIGSAGWTGDTLWVNDRSLSRITTIAGPASPGTEPFSEGSPIRPLTVFARLPGGSVLAEAMPRMGPELMAQASNRGMPFVLVHFAKGGAVLDTIAAYTCRQAIVLVSPTSVEIRGGLPLSDCPLTRVEQDGAAFHRIEHVTAREAGPAHFTISRRLSDGKVQWTKDVPYIPQPVSEALLDSISASLAQRGTASNPSVDKAKQAQYREALAQHNFLPTVTEAPIGIDGALLLGREEFGATRAWDLWDAQGNHVGTITLPTAKKVLAVSSTHVWVSEVNENEEVHVVRYRIGTGG